MLVLAAALVIALAVVLIPAICGIYNFSLLMIALVLGLVTAVGTAVTGLVLGVVSAIAMVAGMISQATILSSSLLLYYIGVRQQRQPGPPSPLGT